MKFNSAVCILTISSAVPRLLRGAYPERKASFLHDVIPLIAVLIGLATLAEYVFQINLGLDELIVKDFSAAESQLFPGRMSPISAFCFLLIGSSVLTMKRERTHFSWLTTALILPPLFLTALSLIGYMYSESALYQFGPFIRISWQTALCCSILSVSILLLTPTKGPIQILTSFGPGGIVARRLFPVVFIVPVFMGFLWLEARRREFVDRELGVSLFVVAVIATFLSVISFVSKRLDLLELERKRLIVKDESSQKALAESEMQFRTMANSIPQLAWMADRHGWIFWYNEQWYDYTGTSLKDMEGWGWEKVHDPNELGRATASWKKSLELGIPWEDKFPLKRKDGKWRWFLSRARPVKNTSGEIVFWFGTNTDIDEQLRTERELIESRDAAEKANEAKTQFLANMSHEIRTPIGAIMGFTDILKNSVNSDSDRASFTNIIERNSQSLLRLIDDILDLSKVEAGKIALEKSDFKLAEFLSDLKSVMALRAVEKGIEFSLKFDGPVPDHINTDPLRLRQILANIIGNAIKFTEKGNVECLVKYETPELLFTVSDTGLGIEPAGQKNLFHAFSQADASMTRRFGGTGLGLILSKRLSNALGGDVRLAKSELGIGSVFTASITPLLSSNARLVRFESLTTSEHLQSTQNERQGRLARLKVLVVDDAPDNRTLVSLYLTKSGAEVSMAIDGVEAVERAMSIRPDVLLMDIQMPKMDGHTATKQLRSLGYSKPIVALTAHAMREERDKCFESGCTDYLTKPIQKDVLIETLERYMPRKT